MIWDHSAREIANKDQMKHLPSLETSARQSIQMPSRYKIKYYNTTSQYINITQMNNESSDFIRVIGLMSGTSLDGLDIACVKFTENKQAKLKWSFELQACETIPYQPNIINLIQSLQNQDIGFLQFRQKQLKYSQFVAQSVNAFIELHGFGFRDIDHIATHGHTIFHTPSKSITVQISNLPYIAAKTDVDVIGNFRQLDVHRGGEGAPLVPYGQELFYKQKTIFINFGGIVNVGAWGTGWDVSFGNLMANQIAKRNNLPYDEDGKIGRKGTKIKLMQQFFEQNCRASTSSEKEHPSFARQDFQIFLHKFQQSKFTQYSPNDILRTYYEYLSELIIQECTKIYLMAFQEDAPMEEITLNCTGGGVFNTYLIQLIREKSKFIVEIPKKQIVQFKEAIIFAFLGLKFKKGLKNCSNGIGGLLAKGNPRPQYQ